MDASNIWLCIYGTSDSYQSQKVSIYLFEEADNEDELWLKLITKTCLVEIYLTETDYLLWERSRLSVTDFLDMVKYNNKFALEAAKNMKEWAKKSNFDMVRLSEMPIY